MQKQVLLVTLLGAAILVAGCVNGDDTVPGEDDADVVVAVGEMYFQQDGDFPENELQAEVGDEILFHNEGTTAHTVTIDELGVDEHLNVGDTTTITVDSADTVDVNCEFHQGHDAELTIE